MSYENAIEQGIELLKLCQRLQSEKDGVERPDPDVIDKTKTLDEFAMSVGESITYMTSLYRLIPMMKRLAGLGRELERQGKIQVDYGEDYAQAALDFVVLEFGQERDQGLVPDRS